MSAGAVSVKITRVLAGEYGARAFSFRDGWAYHTAAVKYRKVGKGCRQRPAARVRQRCCVQHRLMTNAV